MPWPHVQFLPQMGLMGGPGLCVGHFPPDIVARRAILKVHERRSGQDRSRTALNPCCFFSKTTIGLESTGLLILFKVNWSASPVHSVHNFLCQHKESSNRNLESNEVAKRHFLRKAGSRPFLGPLWMQSFQILTTYFLFSFNQTLQRQNRHSCLLL